ncbi:hypothetical protein [Gordonia otitidis]|uniref:Secreted protein n=1 Tax=Gordonia otitidis (strain DSM 44809 / CCUG 52243 / JCM 12355 / NBRC 100426 / IFM 10032) TaxID=1108044 RepID=H5TKI8_GORO1|nr:hypothetical protein [Gordonia otitidis]GAB33996.1 hypothetical protein GOOTI_090_00260 [Gordonia otitidis NBRC 100426]
MAPKSQVIFRRTTVRAGIVAAVVLSAILGAEPVPAAAAVRTLTVAPPSGTGRYGAGCTYTLTARVTNNDPVTFSVRQPTRLANGKLLRFTFDVVPHKHVATLHWSPVVEGRFVLGARQGNSQWKLRGADVGRRLDLGSSCSGI